MKGYLVFGAIIAAFLAGWLLNPASASLFDPSLRLPFGEGDMNATAKSGPSDHIGEDQIFVYKKGIVLAIENATWSRFTDTHSMDPVLNKFANGIEMKPKSPDEVAIGDIISYYSEYAEGLIIHRVVVQGYDSDGWYVLVKGDNLNSIDPGKIRFSQIHGVLVGIIY